MDLLEFFAAARLVVVAGKGGVGKTTVTAALASSAAGAGLRACSSIEVEGKSGLAGLLGGRGDLGYEEVVLRPGSGPRRPGRVRARTLTPGQALERLPRGPRHAPPVAPARPHRRARHRRHRRARASTTSSCSARSSSSSGCGEADLIVLDAPAAGHAITFLQSANGLLDAVRVGPINAQARDVVELLSDPTRCQVLLVTLAEETPVNELVETAFASRTGSGVSLGPVVVNGLYPDLDGLAVDPAAAPPPPAPGAQRRARGAGRRGGVPAGPGRPCSASRSSGWPSGCRSRRSGCRSCSPPSSVRPTSIGSAADLRGRHRGAGVTDGAGGAARAGSPRSGDIVICCGSGGVGKTTTAAAIAAGGGAGGPAGRRGHHRPGQAAGRRPRPRRRADRRRRPGSTGRGRASCGR